MLVHYSPMHNGHCRFLYDSVQCKRDISFDSYVHYKNTQIIRLGCNYSGWRYCVLHNWNWDWDGSSLLAKFLLPHAIHYSQSLVQFLLFFAGPTQTSVSRIFHRVTNILSEKAAQEVNMPHSPQQLQASARDFRRIGDIARVIGAIDGKTSNL